MKRSGRPSQKKKKKAKKGGKGKSPNMTNGWFMLVHPPTLRVLAVTSQHEPENNAVVTKSLKRVLPQYDECDGFMYDRQCRYAPTAKLNPKLEQIEHWAVDPFHGHKHTKKCKFCARNSRALKKRFKKTNGSACE